MQQRRGGDIEVGHLFDIVGNKLGGVKRIFVTTMGKEGG